MSSPVRDNTPSRRPKINTPLWIGGVLLFFILILSIFGPVLAPNDPREHHQIIQINGKWLKPPYPALTPGYPLGSDNLGRDLYSWLLWAVRPTLILVIFVALLRMLLGVIIGAGSGWSDGWRGRGFDALIAAALAAPALLTALILITAMGAHLGLWAFVLGLGITGWAETAQLVREQTRTVKGQQAVEAARALGASGGQIFFLHILPQIMPMVWMLLAFEISNTLVTTACLGFLGYYLGGAVFVEVSDFVYQRISEMPELGQMLATAWMVLDEPWAMVAAGTVVFVIVLAFNLVGEGLQRRLTRKLGGNRALYILMAGDVLPWFEQRLGEPLSNLAQHRAFRPLAFLLLVALVVGGGVVWRFMPSDAETTTERGPLVDLTIPGGHFWSAERHDPWGTAWSDVDGPQKADAVWVFEGDDAFTGGPVVAADGTVIATTKQTLYALNSAGHLLWQATPVTTPVGTPTLDAAGNIYFADVAGGLAAYTPQGAPLWRVQPQDAGYGFSSAVATPVEDGTVYYIFTRSGKLVLQAVSPEGVLERETLFDFSAHHDPPFLGPSGKWLFWQNRIVNVADGIVLPSFAGDPDPVKSYLTGADGNAYARVKDAYVLLARTETGFRVRQNVLWVTERGPSPLTYPQAGGITPDSLGWLVGNYFTGDGTEVVWGRVDSATVVELTGYIHLTNLYQGQAIGADRQSTLYVCGGVSEQSQACYALAPTAEEPLWQFDLEPGEGVQGGALAPGRLYLAGSAGRLYAVGDADE
ncbi:MAG: ABC transporter permease subunit [Anaerolineae bacterium]|nr:ABC transporter permease subunit [Anaerolineae bacterium]